MKYVWSFPIFIVLLASFCFAKTVSNGQGDTFLDWAYSTNGGNNNVTGPNGYTGNTITSATNLNNSAISNIYDLGQIVGLHGNDGVYSSAIVLIENPNSGVREPTAVLLNRTGIELYDMAGTKVGSYSFSTMNTVIITNFIVINPENLDYEKIIFATSSNFVVLNLFAWNDIAVDSVSSIVNWSNEGFYLNSAIACNNRYDTTIRCFLQGVPNFNTFLIYSPYTQAAVEQEVGPSCSDAANLERTYPSTYSSMVVGSGSIESFDYICKDIDTNTGTQYLRTGRIWNGGIIKTAILDTFAGAGNTFNIRSGSTFAAKSGTSNNSYFFIDVAINRAQLGTRGYHFVTDQNNTILSYGLNTYSNLNLYSNFFVGDYNNNGIKEISILYRLTSGQTYLIIWENTTYEAGAIRIGTQTSSVAFPTDMNVESNSWIMGKFSNNVSNYCFAGYQGIVCSIADGGWVSKNINQYPLYNTALMNFTKSFGDPFSSGIVMDNGKPAVVIAEPTSVTGGSMNSDSQYGYKIVYDPKNGLKGTNLDRAMWKTGDGLLWYSDFSYYAYGLNCTGLTCASYQKQKANSTNVSFVVGNLLKNIVNTSESLTINDIYSGLPSSILGSNYSFNDRGLSSEIDVDNIGSTIGLTTNNTFGIDNTSLNYTFCFNASYNTVLTEDDKNNGKTNTGAILNVRFNTIIYFEDFGTRQLRLPYNDNFQYPISDTLIHQYCLRGDQINVSLSIDNLMIASLTRHVTTDYNFTSIFPISNYNLSAGPIYEGVLNVTISQIKIWNRYLSDSEIGVENGTGTGYCFANEDCGNALYPYCVQGCCVAHYDTSVPLGQNQCNDDTVCLSVFPVYGKCALPLTNAFANIGICVNGYQSSDCHYDQLVNQAVNQSCPPDLLLAISNQEGAQCQLYTHGICAPPSNVGCDYSTCTGTPVDSVCTDLYDVLYPLHGCAAYMGLAAPVFANECYEDGDGICAKTPCSYFASDPVKCQEAGCTYASSGENCGGISEGYYYCTDNNIYEVWNPFSTSYYDTDYYCEITGNFANPGFITCPTNESCYNGECASSVCTPNTEICSNGVTFLGGAATGDVYKCRSDGQGFNIVEACGTNQTCVEDNVNSARCQDKNQYFCINNLACTVFYNDGAVPTNCYATLTDCQSALGIGGTGGTGGIVGDGSDAEMTGFWNVIFNGSSFAKLLFAFIMICGVMVLSYNATHNVVIGLGGGMMMLILCSLFGLLPFYILAIFVIGSIGLFILMQYIVKPGTGD